MIHEIKIKNCLSFREEQTLSFEASSDTSYEDFYCVEVKPGMKLLKLGALYGPNASGKTNLLVIIDFLRDTVLNAKSDKFEKIDFSPFRLDNHSHSEDGELSISFFMEGRRFIYELKLNSQFIRSETLIYYPGIHAAVLFNAQFDSDAKVTKIQFGAKLGLTKKEEHILEGNTIWNSSLLSIYLKSNVSNPLLDEVTNWFKSSMMSIIHPFSDLTNWAKSKVFKEPSEQFKKLTIELLGKADFNIVDFFQEDLEQDLDEETIAYITQMKDVPQLIKEKILTDKKIKKQELLMTHETDEGRFNLPFHLQSQGTKRYFGLGVILASLIENGKCVFIDELESSLHYELFGHFIRTFLTNSTNSQLFFTTHNITLLMDDYIRRDVVWFCEKNSSGSSELYSASDFKLHKNISLFNAYRTGKLGAKPTLGDIFMQTHG